MRSVLVIDDEKPTLSMFALLLEAMGYRTFTAADGAEGIEVFERERPRVVFTDIKMPDMDGLEVLRRIKAMDPGAEVIVVTGHGDVELALASLNLDAADFIDKPIRQEALAQALARAEERLAQRGEGQDALHLEEAEQATVLSIGGRLSAASEAAFDQAVGRALERRLGVVVGLEPTVQLTGAGVALIVRLVLETSRAGLKAAVAAPAQAQRAALEAAGVGAAAPLARTLDEALGLVSS